MLRLRYLKIGLGLGLGFMDRVRIRNLIGGAAGAHISMTSCTVLELSQDACLLFTSLPKICNETATLDAVIHPVTGLKAAALLCGSPP